MKIDPHVGGILFNKESHTCWKVVALCNTTFTIECLYTKRETQIAYIGKLYVNDINSFDMSDSWEYYPDGKEEAFRVLYGI